MFFKISDLKYQNAINCFLPGFILNNHSMHVSSELSKDSANILLGELDKIRNVHFTKKELSNKIINAVNVKK